MLEIEGAILAGGESRRMGRDKSALVLGDVSMLERVARAMRPLVERLRVVGGEAAGLDPQPDLRAGLGPLSGIHAALATAERDAVLVVACDLPFVTTGLLTKICERLGDSDASVPRVRGRAIPVCALYRTACLERVEASLDRRELKAQRFVESLRTTYLDVDPEAISLKNVNTPEDLEHARSIAAELD